MGLILQAFELFVCEIWQLWRILFRQIFLYDIDIVEGSMIKELARRSVGKHSTTVQLLC